MDQSAFILRATALLLMLACVTAVRQDGAWSQWARWSSCSVTCGEGNITRIRLCNAPLPLLGGTDCDGNGRETQRCEAKPCPIDGSWGQWSRFAICSATCGGGAKSRTRVCNSPVPQHGGKTCAGEASNADVCNMNDCPIVDGSWGPWSRFAICSATCGGGVKSRTRVCNSPVPQHGGKTCAGEASDTDVCNTNDCPIEFTIEKQDVGVGDNFSMSCTGEGDPEGTIHWWKLIKSTADRLEVNTGHHTSELEITSAELSDAGAYYCGNYKKIEVNVLEPERAKTQCESERDGILSLTSGGDVPAVPGADGILSLIGAFIPECDAKGEYTPQQCWGSTGECWCVDSLGQEKAGTKTPPGTQPKDCPAVADVLDKAVADILGGINAIIKTLKTLASEAERPRE